MDKALHVETDRGVLELARCDDQVWNFILDTEQTNNRIEHKIDAPHSKLISNHGESLCCSSYRQMRPMQMANYEK